MMASVIDIKGILVDCGVKLIVSSYLSALLFWLYNFYVRYPFMKGPM